MDGEILLRCQSREGTIRVKLNASDTLAKLMEIAKQKWPDIVGVTALYRSRNSKEPLHCREQLLNMGFKNGDIVYLEPLANSRSELPGDEKLRTDGDDQLSSEMPTVDSAAILDEDEVDIYLHNQLGIIEREKDSNLCQHGEMSKCSRCCTLDVSEPEFVRKSGMKYAPFHVYLRQKGYGKGLVSSHSLEKTRCTMKKGCRNHKPWPEGFCLQCQPPVITLQRQTYRHVDNISFENNDIANRLFTLWQMSGRQRFGLLIGRYEPYSEVPLGIRAVVTAIYEPPQNDTPSSIELLPDPKESVVQELCKQLGCKVIGMIFTHLFGQMKSGHQVVENLRNSDTYLLSGQDCIRSAAYQNMYPNACKYGNDGFFGSKFVTVVATGGTDGNVHVYGYQASNQCTDMVKADCLLPVLGHPQFVQMRKSSPERFLPDISYRRLDAYGNSILGSSLSVPVEFLFVDITVGVAKNPQRQFNPFEWSKPFPIENRECFNERQNLKALHSYVGQFSNSESLQLSQDFHFLLYLLTKAERHYDMKDIEPLLKAIRAKDGLAVTQWFEGNEHWNELVNTVLIDEEGLQSDDDLEETGPSERATEWKCPHCTFMNAGNGVDCAVCLLPRNF